MSIAKNAGYNLAGKIAPLAVSIVTVPLYLEVIGLERYGVLSLCWLLLGYLGFLELGMGPSVQQRIAELRHGTDQERSEVFWTAFWLNLGGGIVGAVILYFAASWYFQLVDKVSPGVEQEIKLSIPWLALVVPVVLANSIMIGAMKGRERFLAANVVSSLSTVAMSLLPLGAAFAFGPRLDMLIAISLGARAVTVFVQFVQVRRAVPLGPIHAPRRAPMKNLLIFGGWVSVTTILTPLLSTFDRLAIGTWLGAVAVSIYSIPFNLVSRTKVLPESLASAIFPRFASIPPDQRDSLERSAIDVTSALMTPLTLVSIVAVGPFLRLWIGTKLGAQAEPVAQILLVGWWVNSFARVSLARVQGSGRPDFVTKLLLAELPFYGAAMFAGIHYLGVVGAALAWTARVAVDPVALLMFNGQFRRVAARLFLHGLIVTAAAATAYFAPFDHPLRWAALTLLLAVGLMICWRTAPQQVVALREKVIGQAFGPLRKRLGAVRGDTIQDQ